MPRTGRISPLKHSRPTSLTSIAEAPSSVPRTELRLTIDARGRAKTESFVIDEQQPSPTRTRPSILEDFESQYDSQDEDILLPSQQPSFALPQPKGPKIGRFETSNRSLDRRHSMNASFSKSLPQLTHQLSQPSLHQSMQHDGESEAETVMDDDGSGNATRALRKVMENRKKDQLKQRNPRNHRYSENRASSYGNSSAGYSSSNLSPTTISDPDGNTPSSTRSGTTRCVCGSSESEGFMIQWYGLQSEVSDKNTANVSQ
jgi:hypothetical protein